MPRQSTKSAAKPATKREIPPSKTSHLFGGSKKGGDRGASLTSERIEADLKAFRKAGGRIEVLGVTRALTRIDGDGATPTPAAATPRGRR